MGVPVEKEGARVNYEASAVETSIKDVRPLLDLVDKLRTLGIEKDIEIPQIAVIGDQSSGKSSVLEALSGVPFPRGTGLVTRCATEVRLKRSKGAEWKGSARVSWDENFLGDKEQPDGSGTLDTPDDVAKAINTLTEALTDEEFQFSSHSIIIEVEASNVPDITIIDLPGIIRTTVNDQNKDLINQVNNLLNRYLQKERTVILAVVPANQDIATVEVLERASKCDPTGDRTIAVLTKLDIVDDGECPHVARVLENRIKRVKLGFCAVRNRNAKELMEDMTLNDAKVAEKEFFAAHTVFKTLDQSLFGIENLTQKLVSILRKRIQEALPDMQSEINRSLTETENKLMKLGEKPPNSELERKTTYQRLMLQVGSVFESSIKADYENKFFQRDEKELFLYSRACEAFIEMRDSVYEHENIGSAEHKAKLKEKLSECRGRELSCFMPPGIFNAAVADFVDEWPSISEDLCDTIIRTTEATVDLISKKILSMYPHMQLRTASTAKDLIRQLGEEANMSMKECASHESCPFTLNPELLAKINRKRAKKYGDKVDHIFKTNQHMTMRVKAEEHFTDVSTEDQMVEDIVETMKEYCEIAKARFVDNVCMILRSKILDASAQKLPVELLNSTPDEDLDEMFSVDVDTKRTRDTLEQKRDRLRAARHELKRAKF